MATRESITKSTMGIELMGLKDTKRRGKLLVVKDSSSTPTGQTANQPGAGRKTEFAKSLEAAFYAELPSNLVILKSKDRGRGVWTTEDVKAGMYFIFDFSSVMNLDCCRIRLVFYSTTCSCFVEEPAHLVLYLLLRFKLFDKSQKVH